MSRISLTAAAERITFEEFQKVHGSAFVDLPVKDRIGKMKEEYDQTYGKIKRLPEKTEDISEDAGAETFRGSKRKRGHSD